MENATDPASASGSTKIGFSSTSTADTCTNFAALMDAERKKIVNEAHEKAIIVSTAVGALLAIGLILNAIIWCSRLRHRRQAKQRISEGGLRDGMDVERDISAPSPDVARKRTSSRLSMLSRRHRQAHAASHHSDVSEVLSLDAIASASSKGGISANTDVGSDRSHTARKSSASADLLGTLSRSSATVGSTLPNTLLATIQPSRQRLTLRTTPAKLVHSGNEKYPLYVAEAYDDVPEDPADLGGYAVYERCKRETERMRMPKQSPYIEKLSKSS